MRISTTRPEDKLSRAERLPELIRYLREQRRPVSDAELAREMGEDLRTIQRDLAILIAQGAVIEDEAGAGYALPPDRVLPPLAFTVAEAEALILGLRWITGYGDEEFDEAANGALARIVAVLPEAGDDTAAGGDLLVPPPTPASCPEPIRLAIREERKLRIGYGDRKGKATQRTVWPLAVGLFDYANALTAWCEMRGAFRHFRLDRITGAEVLGDRYPVRRAVLMADWRLQAGDDDESS